MVSSRHTVWLLLRFCSLYCTYIPRNACSVIVCFVVQPVGHTIHYDKYLPRYSLLKQTLSERAQKHSCFLRSETMGRQNDDISPKVPFQFLGLLIQYMAYI